MLLLISPSCVSFFSLVLRSFKENFDQALQRDDVKAIVVTGIAICLLLNSTESELGDYSNNWEGTALKFAQFIRKISSPVTGEESPVSNMQSHGICLLPDSPIIGEKPEQFKNIDLVIRQHL